MADISSTEKSRLEKFFGMESGYVLDFSNRTFGEFFTENFGINIYNPKYEYESGSKANRLRAFWMQEDNIKVGELIFKLLEHWKLRKELAYQEITPQEMALFEQCLKISERLTQNKPAGSFLKQEIAERKKKELEATKSCQLNLLLKMFEDLTKSTEPHKRGFSLQDLLNRLFLIYEIPVVQSFQRNEGGEQIDGAFSFQGWHYLVECKWTKKLSDIRELDSLLGKVNRSGKQAMGLFLSIEGWSENVPTLLKQNPDKCIILMDGYDLRSVLSEAVGLERLLIAKIAKLNISSEPFLSAVDIMKEQI